MQRGGNISTSISDGADAHPRTHGGPVLCLSRGHSYSSGRAAASLWACISHALHPALAACSEPVPSLQSTCCCACRGGQNKSILIVVRSPPQLGRARLMHFEPSSPCHRSRSSMSQATTPAAGGPAMAVATIDLGRLRHRHLVASRATASLSRLSLGAARRTRATAAADARGAPLASLTLRRRCRPIPHLVGARGRASVPAHEVSSIKARSRRRPWWRPRRSFPTPPSRCQAGRPRRMSARARRGCRGGRGGHHRLHTPPGSGVGGSGNGGGIGSDRNPWP